MTFDPTVFMQHWKLRNFCLKWDTHFVSECSEFGATGRYGVGYGKEEHYKDIANKYGINEPNFTMRCGIDLYFTIFNEEGFEYLLNFAKGMGYPEPKKSNILIKGGIKDEKGLEKAVQENVARKAKASDLISQLEQIADVRISDLDVHYIDLVPFYEWSSKTCWPQDFFIVESNPERVRSIWYDTDIMKQC